MMMIHIQEFTSLRIPCTTISRDWMLSVFLYQIFYKCLSNKDSSLKGNMNIYRITLSIESMAIQSHAYWLPTLSNVSSIINSDTFLLFWKIFLGLYRWIHFHIETWFLLINCDNCCDVFLSERPEKYNCNAYIIYLEGVLFLLLLSVRDVRHMQL